MIRKKFRHRPECFNRFVIKDDYAIMYIESKKHGIKEVLIDTNKIPEVSKVYWHVAKMYDNYFSVIGWVREKQKEVLLHRYLTNCPNGLLVDHINRNPLDNRMCNLRCVNTSENMLNSNTQKNCLSGHKGVRYRKDCNKFQARIMVNKKSISIGHFDNLLDAIIARKEFCEKNNIIA